MSDEPPREVTHTWRLRCDECGHTWRGRSAEATPCPECDGWHVQSVRLAVLEEE